MLIKVTLHKLKFSGFHNAFDFLPNSRLKNLVNNVFYYKMQFDENFSWTNKT
jgi:hypothetical protein